MANLQVKNVPDDLYEAVRERARSEGLTISDLVLRNLRREVEKPSLKEWVAMVRQQQAGRPTRDIDTQKIMDEVRAEWE